MATIEPLDLLYAEDKGEEGTNQGVHILGGTLHLKMTNPSMQSLLEFLVTIS